MAVHNIRTGGSRVRNRFTPRRRKAAPRGLSQDGHRSVTGVGRAVASLALDMMKREGTMTIKTLLPALALALALGVAACGGADDEGTASGSNGGGGDRAMSGKIAIDGSSTVAPFAQAAAELFNEENPDVKVTVGTSGTGGGFEKFCAGETDISDASRPIKDDEEV